MKNGKLTVLVGHIKNRSDGFCGHIYDLLDKERFNVIGDFGDNFQKTTKEDDVDICLLIHGNRHVETHKKRFEYLDSICDNVWCIMASHINEYIIYDRNGYSGGSGLARNERTLDVDSVTSDLYEPLYEELYNKYVATGLSKYSQPDNHYDATEPYLLILGQVSGDSAIKCGSLYYDYISTMLTAIPILNEIGIKVIYKGHPKEQHFHGKIIADLIKSGIWENVEYNDEHSLKSLVSNCKAVVTLNSGSGFESLMYLKKVFTLGRADYNLGAINCSTVEDIKNIGIMMDEPVDEVYIKKFLYAYLSTTMKRCGRKTYNVLVDKLMGINDKEGLMSNDVRENMFIDSIMDVNVLKKPVLWRKSVMHSDPNGLFLEFGVLDGKSIRRISSYIEEFHGKEITVYGFDSFEGLPEAWVLSDDLTKKAGTFNRNGNLPKNTEPNIKYVSGFFQDSLEPWLEDHKDQDVSFLHIDSDLYSSAKYVLTTLNDKIKTGTIIVFDELIEFNPNGEYKNWKDGEWEAFNEWLVEFDRMCIPLYRTSRQQVAFQVTK